MKLNPVGSEEVLSVSLSRAHTPIAFKNKVDELMEQGAFNTREEAERWVETTPIVLEIYYEKHSGLFAVEADALEGSAESICSPYSKSCFEY